MKSKQEYFNRLLEACGEDDKKKEEYIKEAYKVALDTRKFEIDLYWKRATYFWAFITAIFVAYFTAITRITAQPIEMLAALLALLGFFFSLGWHMVARGSKVWQENWEMHIGYLEEEIHGPLFKTFNVSKIRKPIIHTKEEFPYSVSKVNQILSLFTCFFWLLLFLYSFKELLPQKFKNCLVSCMSLDVNILKDYVFPLLIIMLLFVGLCTLYNFSKSFQYKEIRDKEDISLIKGEDGFQSFYFKKRESIKSEEKKSSKFSLFKYLK